MRATLFILASCLLAAATAQQTYQLVWSDEFNGNSLDMSKWQFEINCDGGGNNEKQCYTNSPKNLQVKDGNLVITAVPENVNGKGYSSSRINTQKTAAWKYGRIDFNAKLPGGQYLWPALWMMPRDSVYGGWAASGEIDIMESRGGDNTQEGTLHFGGSWPNNVYEGSGPRKMSFDMTQDFHLYSCIWTPDSIQFLVDNQVFHTMTMQRSFYSGKGNNPYSQNGQPFDQYFFLIINLAVGGGFFGGNADSINWDIARNWNGASFYIDYVRVYQLKDAPIVTPTPAPTPSPTPSPSICTDMYNGLKCRTSSQDPSKIDGNAITSTRAWLCGADPKYCTGINNGGTYSSCNAAEQVSFAMNQYYSVYGASQGAGACDFGGIGRVNSASVTPTTQNPATKTPTTQAATNPATSSCSSMFNGLSCRTSSQDPSKMNLASVTSSRNWLCGSYPQYCAAINSGGEFSGCNAAEQLSYAMNQYYAAFGPSQGAKACDFGGVGLVAATQQSPCQTMFSSLKCRTKSQNPASIDTNKLNSARTWLCGAFPQLCASVNNGGQYSSCNAAEQLSFAMNEYYKINGWQGNAACDFGGIGQVQN